MNTETIKRTAAQAKTTERISGSEAVIRCLLAEGVDILYGYPGGAIMPVYDELYKYQDKIHHVLTRHEQCATHSAQGYARISGKVGVVSHHFWQALVLWTLYAARLHSQLWNLSL